MQPGGVPVWISGTVNRRVASRLARFGSGWIPWGDDAADPVASLPRMRELVAAAGGDPLRLRVVGNLRVLTDASGEQDVEASVAAAAESVAAGVTDFTVRPRIADPSAAGDVYRAWATAFHHAVG